MSTLDQLDELRRTDVLTAKQSLLSKSIDDAMHALSNLETKIEKKNNTFNDLNQTIEELEQENDEYGGESIQVPHYSESTKKLEFFDQLKVLESEADHYNSQIKAHTQNITDLTTEVSNTAQKHKRLLAKIEQLKEELNTASDTLRERNGVKVELQQKIKAEDDEIEALQKLCEQIREDAQKQAEEMKDITPEAMQLLILQKDALVQEVRKAEEEKQKLETKKKQKESKHAAKENLSQKGLNKNSSPLVWMAERNALMIKIKKARDELSQLATRSKSAIKSKQRTEMKKEQLNFTEADVKKAILLEIQEIENADDSFIEDAISTELHYQDELNLRMSEIERTTSQIHEFKDNMMDLMQSQDEIAASTERLELLKQELNELRSKL